MKKVLFYSIISFIVIFNSCKDENISLIGTKWQSVDRTMTFKFETDTTCTMNFFIDPDNQNEYQTAHYIYFYDNPDIVLLIAPSSGFGSYSGSINGNIMKLKLKDSTFDYINFQKTN